MEKEIKGVCYICGMPLVYNESDENCHLNDYMEIIIKEINCKHCGTMYSYYISKENDTESEIDYVYCRDQGFGKCAHCGGNIIWSGDFMRSDFYNDPIDINNQLDDDDDAIVRSLVCGHCGCHIEASEPTPNEIKNNNYPYWQSEDNVM